MSNNENREKIADVLFDDDEDEVVVNKVGEQKEVVNFDIIQPHYHQNNNQDDEINISIPKKNHKKSKDENPNINMERL